MHPRDIRPIILHVNLTGQRGIGGLYSGVAVKMCHLGFGGAILAVLMPRFKSSWFEMNGLEA